MKGIVLGEQIIYKKILKDNTNKNYAIKVNECQLSWRTVDCCKEHLFSKSYSGLFLRTLSAVIFVFAVWSVHTLSFSSTMTLHDILYIKKWINLNRIHFLKYWQNYWVSLSYNLPDRRKWRWNVGGRFGG